MNLRKKSYLFVVPAYIPLTTTSHYDNMPTVMMSTIIEYNILHTISDILLQILAILYAGW